MDTATGGIGTDTLLIDAGTGEYRIEFTSGGFVPDGDSQQLQSASGGVVYFATGGSVTFSQFERKRCERTLH